MIKIISVLNIILLSEILFTITRNNKFTSPITFLYKQIKSLFKFKKKPKKDKLKNYNALVKTLDNKRHTIVKYLDSNKSTVLLVILSFSFLTRVINLHKPPNEYFDEVYHAFTARRMLHNDPKAWEWWNTSPEGFAYEWTHPPLAKELMILGMIIFGENSFGWRIPAAIFGTAVVFVVFLITKYLFKDNTLALLASAIFSLDGLPIVMSRIGMNDMYFLFFALLALYLFFKNNNFWSALCLGLSAASKWTFMWSLPIFAVSHFVLRKKIRLSYLWFFILPPVVYIASYLPMFLTGHNFDIFIGVQKQMWWYHTGLNATHAYSSPWWSWPILARPVWLYTNTSNDGFVGNIYAMGNPLLFWSGIVAIITSAINSYYRENKQLALVIFSYLIFFVPWAASPRIMFLYHYLPSIPFLSILLAYMLRKSPNLIIPMFIVIGSAFLYFYPHWTGLSIPVVLDSSYYLFTSWK
jgi:dolichyl-phosphate-mannose--protein O-mannosyl transferase